MNSSNLISYAVQSGIVLIAGLVAPRVLGMRAPRAALRYWQALLAAVLLLPLLQPWRLAAAGSVTVEGVGVRLVKGIHTVVPAAASLAVTEWALLGIAAVAAARLAWLAVGLLVLRGYRRRARPLERLPVAVDTILRGSSARVRFLISDRVPTPIAFGWRRPTVLVPPSFESLPEAHQVCIGCHELLHVRRRDWLAVIAEQVLRAALWFHPAVLILLGRIELSREQLVDREVVRLTGDRRTYLDALLSMARRHERTASTPALFLLNRSDLRERVALLAREAHMPKQRVLAALVAATAVVAVAGASAAALFPLTKTTTATASRRGVASAVGDEKKTDATKGEEVRHPVKYDPDAGITAPKIIHKVDPTYPEEARKQGIQGLVVSEAIIDSEGTVVDVKVLESPDEILNQPTVDALTQWKFEPATKDGEPVDVIYAVTVKYALE